VNTQWYTRDDDALLISVRLQPRASRDEIVGVQGTQLKIRVTAPPVDGKANAALIRLLAKTLRLPKSAIQLSGGDTSRDKRLRITPADPVTLADLPRRLSGKH
jgi:uncharacterized protein (TIGR00251 family)